MTRTYPSKRSRQTRYVTAVVVALSGSVVHPATAMDFTCVESSRYKVIAKLFGDDPRPLVAYFGLSAHNLPPPEACRAALVTGRVAAGDAEKLIALIAQNGGWLDTLYLNSGGGSVDAGLRTALVTRLFWLKTRLAPAGQQLVYDPDFGPPRQSNPPDADRLAFDKAAAAVATRYGGERRAFCASACTYTLAAGVDRHGIANVHRPVNHSDSLDMRARAAESAEDAMMAIYRKMDVGDAFMALTRATARQTTSPAVVSRYPRFVEDALLDSCKSDGAQLDDLSALLALSLSQSNVSLVPVKLDRLKDALAKVEARRNAVVQCVSGQYEKERLAAFGRHCQNGCSGPTLKIDLDKQITDLKR